MNEIIKYHNDFNSLALKDFTAQELDLLMTLFCIVKDKDAENITLTFDQLRSLSKYDRKTDTKRFVGDLTRTNRKLLNLQFKAVSEDESVISQFVLFTAFDIFVEKKILKIAVNTRFTWILNTLTSQFTRFELDEFISLKSHYSKTMYKLLKQFRQTGYYKVSIIDFRHLLNIPECYKQIDIDRKVIRPILTELPKYFNSLKMKKIKQGRGGKVVAMEFTFQREFKPVSQAVKTNPALNYSQRDTSPTTQELFPDIF